MRIAYIGNFVPDHSTENHVRTAWLSEGHEVIRVQEGDLEQWDKFMVALVDDSIDLVLWTRTGDLADKIGHLRQWRMLALAQSLNIPTVAFHLDRWWGLKREHLLADEPFFRCEYVITADGGHQPEFESIGVNHFWLPPAVSLPETELGTAREEYQSQIAFVGSWQAGYHAEWTHRPELINWLQKNYPQTRFWPRPNQHAIRGSELRDLYASTDIVIGDSCLVGGATHYWSDRIPETVGRGGFLIHPHVEGLEEHFAPMEHLLTWEHGNWHALRDQIEWSLTADVPRAQIARKGREHVRANHTYEKRVSQILEIVNG